MAMRSLISKLSGRTGRMPLSAGAAAPKDNPGMEAKRQQMEEKIRPGMVEHRNRIRLYDVNTALLAVLGLGAAYYIWLVQKRQSKGRREA